MLTRPSWERGAAGTASQGAPVEPPRLSSGGEGCGVGIAVGMKVGVGGIGWKGVGVGDVFAGTARKLNGLPDDEFGFNDDAPINPGTEQD